MEAFTESLDKNTPRLQEIVSDERPILLGKEELHFRETNTKSTYEEIQNIFTNSYLDIGFF